MGDLIVMAARPSVGKTSLALGVTFNVARRGHTVLLFSLEMDVKQIVSRFLAMNSRTDLLISGTCTTIPPNKICGMSTSGTTFAAVLPSAASEEMSNPSEVPLAAVMNM